MKGLCAKGALTKDAESEEQQWAGGGGGGGGGGDVATPNEEGKGRLSVKSWVQHRSLAEMDAGTGAQGVEEQTP